MARSVAQGIVQALVKDGLVVELDRQLYLADHGMSFVRGPGTGFPTRRPETVIAPWSPMMENTVGNSNATTWVWRGWR